MNVSRGIRFWTYEIEPRFHPFIFENTDLVWWQNMMLKNWTVPFYVTGIYLSLVFSLEKFMKNRKPFQLRGTLILWNLTMAAINLFGFLRQAPELLIHLGLPDGFHRSLCVREELNQPAAHWGLMFVLTKFIFLGDTFLIVLTKRPLLFIYWYHHSLAIIVPWMIFPDSEPICRWIAVTNYFVLTTMYLYFALKAMSIKLPRQFGLFVATLHVIEMIIGAVIQIYTANEIMNGRECARTFSSIRCSLIPHVSLVFFFAHLLYKYIQPKPKDKKM